ncbi:unnamed protein product [Soboliphyme baturini]|uniref:Hepatocyte growth factor-regulated tyrosine kinase substrate n=1 Tax=Soboliphyme baturini TaxID=241478 RepID=A0A183ILV5_9BILA|nr:unnamed protein product [Soboliphyme baturini]
MQNKMNSRPKVAFAAVRKRYHSDNPHIAHHALHVLEALVKNCGDKMHKEITTKEAMEDLKHLAADCPDKVKEKILELIQCWAHAFRDKPEYRLVKDTHTLMKLEGYSFPTLRESDAMFTAETAPEWVDDDRCHRCQTQFTLINRKHHCRNCGQIFCDKCSSRYIPLPHIGIERDVRVCETCFDKEPSEEQLREAEELQLAMALSQSEAEEKERLKKNEAPVDAAAEAEGELARYLNRQYWENVRKEQKSNANARRRSPTPSAPAAPAVKIVNGTADTVDADPDGVVSAFIGPLDEDRCATIQQFSQNLLETILLFCNRIKMDQNRGRSLISDSSVQTMFMTLTSMHSQLLKYLQEVDDNRTYFETLQDKLTQIRDAREAVDALREEHQQRRQYEMMEQQRQRHLQMVAKLESMRIKKHEMLEQQRLMALQKIDEEEREMALRKQAMLQQQAYVAGEFLLIAHFYRRSHLFRSQMRL